VERQQAGQRLNLTEEITTAQASGILGVSKDTVLHYLEAGLLPYRNIAAPGSSRPVYRLPLPAVLEMRNRYEVAEQPATPVPEEPQRRRVNGPKRYKHLNLGDD
jgi:hypothetical protein